MISVVVWIRNVPEGSCMSSGEILNAAEILVSND